jgi:hypothetical protein
MAMSSVAKVARRSWLSGPRAVVGLCVLGGGLYIGYPLWTDRMYASGLDHKDFQQLRDSNKDGSRDILVHRLSLAVRDAPRSQLSMTSKDSSSVNGTWNKQVGTGEEERVWWLGQPWFNDLGMGQCIRLPTSDIKMTPTGNFSCTVPMSTTWNVVVPVSEIKELDNAISVVTTQHLTAAATGEKDKAWLDQVPDNLADTIPDDAGLDQLRRAAASGAVSGATPPKSSS